MGRRRQLTGLVSASMAAFAIPFSLIAGFLIAAITPFGQSAVAHNHRDLHHLRYGYPVAWLSQDQHVVPPTSYPAAVAWDNPMDTSTAASPGAFIADDAIITSAILVPLLLTAGAIKLVGNRRDGAEA